MSYTKEEWKYDEELGANFSMISGENAVVCGLPNPIGIGTETEELKEMRANAHLIVAAPKMYEALGELLEITHDLTLGDGSPDPQVEAANRKARQARAKAEGKEGEDVLSI